MRPDADTRFVCRGQPPKKSGNRAGTEIPLAGKVTQPDGKVLLTEGQGGGKVQWKDLRVTASGVNVNNVKGVVSLAGDPGGSDGRLSHVAFTVPSYPGLRADLDVPFGYDVRLPFRLLRQARHGRFEWSR